MENYSYNPKSRKTRFAQARADALNISPKEAREVAHNLRGLLVPQAERMLAGVIAKTKPIKFTRFNTELGHKPGIGPGRFPVNAATEFSTLVASAKANAKAKGLDEGRLYVASAVANRSFHKRPGGARVFSKGPSNRSRRANIQVVLEERKG
ncbi:MAG: 50S ribosomal protein L22 [archaeon]